MTELKVSKNSLWCFFAITLLVHLTMVKIQHQYLPVYDRIRTISVVLLIVLILPYIKSLFKKKSDVVLNVFVLSFMCVVLYSSYVNRAYESSRIAASIQYAVGLAEVFFVFQILQQIDRTELAKKCIYCWLLFYCLLSDYLMFAMPRTYGTVDGYLIGNKFQISYLHIMLFVLCYALNEGKKKRFFLLSMHYALAVYISIVSACSTALVGCGIIAIMVILRDRIEKVIRSWGIALGMIGICDSLLLVNAAILTNKHVSYFIQDILGKNATLTGRLRIYSLVHLAVEKNIWFGSGIENNYAVTMEAFSAANAQNGLLDCLVSFGVVGVILLACILMMSFNRGKSRASYPLYLIVYVFIFISMVEVTFKQDFIVFLAMIAYLWEENWLEENG